MASTDITRTRVLFCDMLNLPRGKYVPVDVAAGGKLGFARRPLRFHMTVIF